MVGWRVHCKPRKPTKNNNLFSVFEWRRTLPICRNKLNIEGGADISPKIISQSYFSKKRFPNTFVPKNTQTYFPEKIFGISFFSKENVTINFENFLFTQIYQFCPVFFFGNEIKEFCANIFFRSIFKIYVGI